MFISQPLKLTRMTSEELNWPQNIRHLMIKNCYRIEGNNLMRNKIELSKSSEFTTMLKRQS